LNAHRFLKSPGAKRVGRADLAAITSLPNATALTGWLDIIMPAMKGGSKVIPDMWGSAGS